MARIYVNPDGPVANFIIQREDGHELSLSSMGNGNLVEWKGCHIINDYGDWHKDAAEFLKIAVEFLAVESEPKPEPAPANVYVLHPHRDS